jgi:hypothetical protein
VPQLQEPEQLELRQQVLRQLPRQQVLLPALRAQALNLIRRR